MKEDEYYVDPKEAVYDRFVFIAIFLVVVIGVGALTLIIYFLNSYFSNNGG